MLNECLAVAEQRLRSAPRAVVVQHLGMLGALLQSRQDGQRPLVWLERATSNLLHLPEDVLEAVVMQVERTCTFLPSIADMLAFAQPEMTERNRAYDRLQLALTWPEPGADDWGQPTAEQLAALDLDPNVRWVRDRAARREARPVVDYDNLRSPTADELAALKAELGA